MENKTGLQKLTRLIILSWVATALFAFLFIIVKFENIKLKSLVVTEKHKLASFESISDEYERLKAEKIKWDNATVDYIDWQFVLRDQINMSGVKILAALNNIEDIRHNKELANLLYYNLGLSYMMAVDFDSAIKYFKTATDLKSADADSWYNLGLLYSTFKNDSRNAIRCYNKFLALLPNSPKSGEVKTRIEALKNE